MEEKLLSQTGQITERTKTAMIATGGQWEVFNSGKSVRQTVNGGASYFVSDEEFIDVTINGTFRVNTSVDDDWVGFVFGYKNPTDNSNKRQEYYLFDWKQLDQQTTSQLTSKSYGMAREGFCLLKINDSIDFSLIGQNNHHHENFLKTYWAHREDRPEIERLDSLYGTQYGWPENTDVSFSLTYTTKKIIIEINNDTIFNIDGCFEPGKFGFYNLSQAASEYKNFSYELIPDFQTAVPDGCIDTEINFNAINSACQDIQNYVSPIKTWEWEFEPGITETGNNVSHTFNNPGIYDVKLTVGDGGTCSTSVVKSFEVKGLQVEASKDYLCASDNLTLTATSIPGATYNWFKDGSIFQTTGSDPTLVISETGEYHVEIEQPAEYECNLVSNKVNIVNGVPAATVYSSNGAVCTGQSVTLTAPAYSNAVYTWLQNGEPASGDLNQAGNVISVNTPGNYTVLIEAENGCSATSEPVTLVEGNQPSISISSDIQEICPYEMATLSAVHDGVSVAWYKNSIATGETSNSIEVSQAGKYYAVATTADACTTASSEIEVVVKPLPNVSLSSSKPGLCPGEEISLSVSEPAATTYFWYKDGNELAGESEQSLQVSIEGTYQSVVIASNGCKDTSLPFIANSFPSPQAVFSASGQEFCAGESLLLTAGTVTSAVYEWILDGEIKKSGTSNTYSLVEGGNVTLRVISNKCETLSESQTFIKNAIPEVTISSEVNSLCYDATGVLAVEAGENNSFEWFKDNVSLGQNMDKSLTIESAGEYYVKVDNGKCTASSSPFIVSENTVPSEVSNITGSTTYCEGSVLNFSASAVTEATYYNWTVSPANAASIGEGQGTTDVTINFRNPTGTVTVTCTPENECGQGTGKNISLTKENFCTDYIKFSADKTVICAGSSVTFSAHTTPMFNSSYRYKFSTESGLSDVNGTSANVTFNQAGTFDVTVVEVDFFGNETISETKYGYIIVNEGTSGLTITGEQNPKCNHSYTYTISGASENEKYNWQVPVNATIIAGQNTNAVTVYFENEGTGSIEATALTGGCSSTPNGLTVTASCGIISGLSNSTEAMLRVHPNPAIDQIIVSGLQTGLQYNYVLINEFGQSITPSGVNGILSLRGLPSGIYMLMIYDENGFLKSEKFLKK